MATAIPIFRIFDYNKALEFYVDWLGFTVDWDHRFTENFPVYLQVSLGGIVIHLSEHHGDCTPGGRVHIQDYGGLTAYHKLLTEKKYKYNKPGIEKAFWNSNVKSMEVTDPFGNRLTFTGE